jgi:hypothetical protein
LSVIESSPHVVGSIVAHPPVGTAHAEMASVIVTLLRHTPMRFRNGIVIDTQVRHTACL